MCIIFNLKANDIVKFSLQVMWNTSGIPRNSCPEFLSTPTTFLAIKLLSFICTSVKTRDILCNNGGMARSTIVENNGTSDNRHSLEVGETRVVTLKIV